MATHLEVTDELADAAINEFLIRVGHRKAREHDEFRWQSEGPRRVRDLDTARGWIAGKG